MYQSTFYCRTTQIQTDLTDRDELASLPFKVPINDNCYRYIEIGSSTFTGDTVIRYFSKLQPGSRFILWFSSDSIRSEARKVYTAHQFS